ncbi:sulfite exporter TauE/SafE family protein [Flavihumibacter cheonanensis]|uniref:sulfite exporter TauE/SafE family protein n=1 Tax=Flavihumibacter cheonanensis TaxID=1442385 RepID=UPI001EF97EF0|nr:sulfite exporter TauE/SafE family protein [Flavihumibacter cheonanensis]MCG7753984.1 sulfite exporter TauE/SafE family protein [Flavihumibacter cheonanensis]
MDATLIFYIILFVVAFLYASVGHGGASGYLALMALYGFAPEVMKPTALLLNLFVSLTSYIQFYRGGHFKWKIFLPLALVSIPMAFIGGLLTIDATIYKKILGALLLLPILRFFLLKDNKQAGTVESQVWVSVFIGAGIGFLSGLIGIGGGIILSPILLLLNWTNQKQTAAISALFIFVNSLSGLFGQLTKGIHFSTDMLWMVVIAFGGGLLGAWFGSLKFRQEVLKFTLATVLTLAAFKLLFTSA